MTEQISANTNPTEQPEASAVDANAIQSADVSAEPTPSLTPELKQLLGRPPLLISEDETLYWKIFEQLAALVHPRDFVEWIYVKGFVDRHWETGWYRSAKIELLNLGRKHALADIARKLIDHKRGDYLAQVHRLSTNWFVDPKVREEFREILKLMRLTEDCIPAQALANNVDKYRVLEGLDAGATTRRDASLRALDRRRLELSPPGRTKEVGIMAIDKGADEPVTGGPSLVPQVESADGGDRS
jgi:hypothetical protein